MAELKTNIQNNLTVLILAAGHGRRMGPFSRMVNKSLIPYDNRPLISHIMDKFGADTKFVIACGYLGQQVQDYVNSVHSDKNITFVNITNYDESSTGPATTIIQCRQYLNNKFMWISCDTLFDFDFTDKLDHSWIAVSPVNSEVASDYCWIERNGNDITEVHNKESSTCAVDAFIGLMYVNDSGFIQNLIKHNSKDVFEGFKDINLSAYTVKTWKDFGTYDKWQLLSKDLAEVSFPKPDEIFYRDNGKIIKFATDKALTLLKYERSRLNPHCLPTNIKCHGNFLVYDEAAGDTLYTHLTPAIFLEFLNWANTNVWIKPDIISDISIAADNFYRVKTVSRIEKFRIKYNEWEEPAKVNGHDVKTIEEYINEIDFDSLANNSIQCFIHGDMQFDNIIYDGNRFTVIDWRTDFAGDRYGDIYYDLAKMLGGLYLSYKDIKEDKFSYSETNNEVFIDFPSVDSVHLYSTMLQQWCYDNNYDWQKVKTLVPLIYLNMAPLHEAPFDKFLIAMSQLFFSQL